MQTDTGLIARLDSLQRQINELTRRSTGGSVEVDTVTLDADAPTIEFTNIPQHYRHLQLVFSGGHTAAASSACLLRYNGISSNTYEMQWLQASGTTVSSNRFTTIGHIEVGVLAPGAWPHGCVSETLIANYAVPTGSQWSTSRCTYQAGASQLRSWHAAGVYWGSSIAVTSVTVFPVNGQLTAGTVASLYGMK